MPRPSHYNGVQMFVRFMISKQVMVRSGQVDKRPSGTGQCNLVDSKRLSLDDFH